ncbi:hypothetical protein GCM10027347_59610 [Larkinella harenae]
MGGNRWSQIEIESLISLFESGHTAQEIAEELGRSVSTVHYKLRELRKMGEIS